MEMEITWPACAGKADACDGDAWVEVSPATVEQWREQAWRGSLDEAGREPRCGGSCSDDGMTGPGTASVSGESLRSRDVSMSDYSGCAPGLGARARPAAIKCFQLSPALFGGSLPERARWTQRRVLTRARAMCPSSARAQSHQRPDVGAQLAGPG
jgi:hypothetical protein